MGIFDIFSQSQNTPAQQQKPQQPQQQSKQTTPGAIPDQPNAATVESSTTAPNGAVPAGSPTGEPDSPLANFKDLWETKPTDPNAPSDKPAGLNPADVQKVVNKANFAEALSPETLAAIAEGGDQAQVALMEALNTVAKNVMVQSTLVNNKLTEQAVSKALEAQQAKIPDLLRKQAVADHSKTTNPIFSDPAVLPVMESTQQALMQKFPNATPAEITTMTQDYIMAMASAFSPAPPANQLPPGETDWEAFLTS